MCMISLALLECDLTFMYANLAVTAVLQHMHEMCWIPALENYTPVKKLVVLLPSREHKLYDVLSCSYTCDACVVVQVCHQLPVQHAV